MAVKKHLMSSGCLQKQIVVLFTYVPHALGLPEKGLSKKIRMFSILKKHLSITLRKILANIEKLKILGKKVKQGKMSVLLTGRVRLV